ncbi:MAG: inositol monophosphatase family protein [Candidatus Thorarchaeota archaeon]|jgi:myo-inositol-1(or 4)-monophosphatase
MTLTKDLTRAVDSARTVILNNLAEAAELTGDTNQYGDETLLLDKKAEDEIIRIIHQLDTPMTILSEERGLIVPEGRPEYIAVIDPIDGSANIERGLPLCTIGISVIRHSEKMTTDDAEISIIESVFSDEIFIAEMGRGVRRNGRTIRVADPIPLERSIISYDTKKSGDETFLKSSMRVIEGVHDIRRTATNLLDLSWVASGALNAMVDLRGMLPIVHVSGTHMVFEAGGYVVGSDGNRLNLPIVADQMMSFVAASDEITANGILTLFLGH